MPLLIPPVNAAHAPLVREQQKRRGWKGFIVPIPNCTTTGLAITLAPLAERFGVKAVLMTTLQAMSGAGRSPGVIGLDILDNVIPYIPKEEHKVEVETKKILGALHADGAAIAPHDVQVSCTCTRVAVLEGHTEAVFVSLGKKATVAEVAAAMREWQGAEVAARACRPLRRGGLRCSTIPSAPSPGWTATPTAAWPPRWAASARTGCWRTASSTCSSPTTPRWAPPRAPSWWPSCCGPRGCWAERARLPLDCRCAIGA